MATLTAGAVQRVHNGDTTSSPTMQIIDVKRIGGQGGAQERYRLVISDGVHYQQAMLATQLNEMVSEGKVETRCVVQLKEYLCNTVQNKKIVIILDMDVVGQPCAQIGNPENVESPSQASTNAPAAQPMEQAAPAKAAPAQKPAPSFGSYGRGAVSRAPSSISSSNVQPISSLNPYRSPWTIKAMVDSKSDMRTWNNARGSGNLFSMDLKDDSGLIRATAFKEQADKFYASMEVGKSYLISRGQIKPANRKFNKTSTVEYEITLDRDSVVEEQTGAGNLKIEYDFKKISELEAVAPQETVDVVGMLISCADVQEITSRAGKQLKKRDITLVDDSGAGGTAASISMTLWGSTAEGFNGDGNPVLVARKVMLSEWNGRSLGLVGASTISINPDLPEAHQLRGWYDDGGKDASVTELSTRGGGGNSAASGPNTNKRKSFTQAKEEGVDRSRERPSALYNCRGTISMVKTEGTISYPSDPETKKKLVQVSENEWRNESTNKTFEKPQYRYAFNVVAKDFSGNCWITCFDDTGSVLVGKTAEEVEMLKQQKDNGDAQAEGEFTALFDDMVGKDWVFRCMMKEETYQDEARLKTSLIGVDAIDYTAESKHILSNLKSQFGVTV